MDVPDFLKDLLGHPLKKKEAYIIMFNCAIKMEDTDSRCKLAGNCGHYPYCLAAVTRGGYTGWRARNL